MNKQRRFGRREFLQTAPLALAGAAAFPTIVKASTLGRQGAVAPSDRIVMAGIGFGMQGPGNMRNFLGKSEVQWVAVCDLDDVPLKRAQDTVNTRYGNKDCATYKDYRELFARGDLDAVSLAVPDQWHAILSISAVRAGLDVYGEKPFTHSLREGRALCQAISRYGRVWQTGSWQRSEDTFHRAAELVRNGRVGKILRVKVGLPSGYTDFARTFGQEKIENPPAGFDYDTWLGPAPWSPYCVARVHMNWRWNMDYAGGQLMDWVGHHLDIAHWALDLERTGPVEVKGTGVFPTKGIYNAATKYWVETKYADGTPMVLAGGYPEIRSGAKWMGHRRVDLGGPRRVREPAGSPHQRDGRPEDDADLPESGPLAEFPRLVRSRAATLLRRKWGIIAQAWGTLASSPSRLAARSSRIPPPSRSSATPGAERLLSRSFRKRYQMPA